MGEKVRRRLVVRRTRRDMVAAAGTPVVPNVKLSIGKMIVIDRSGKYVRGSTKLGFAIPVAAIDELLTIMSGSERPVNPTER